jgi:hypothetical protein
MKDETPSQIVEAITAIKQARSAPVQEPVAWYRDEGEIRIYYESKCWDDATPLYTTQPAAQRQWVSLTDSEIKRIGKLDLDSNYFGLWYDFAKAIEQRLKEKNT